MSEDSFLTRWSRRKLAAEQAEKPEAKAPDEGEPGAGLEANQPPQAAEPKPEEEFDPASLPPIDSINAMSDVAAFLRRGVPEELTRAALRRAWTSDPAIRDFVGLAENAWDFNDPSAMPGFGPLDYSPERVRQLVAEMLGETSRAIKTVTTDQAATASPSTSSSDAASQSAPSPDAVAATQTKDATVTAETQAAADHADVMNPATQQSATRDTAHPRRRHGRALPS